MSVKVHESHTDNKMDPKYRVSIPVGWRPDVEGEPVRLQMSAEHKVPVIKVFSRAQFEDKFRQIEQSPLDQTKKNALVGSLRMNSKEAQISGQGKLTVPKEWAERIGLKAEALVRLAGRGPYYILCTEESFDKIAEIELMMDDGGLGVL